MNLNATLRYVDFTFTFNLFSTNNYFASWQQKSLFDKLIKEYLKRINLVELKQMLFD